MVSFQRIAEEAGMTLQQTERCLQHLHQCDIIALVEPIQVSESFERFFFLEPRIDFSSFCLLHANDSSPVSM